MSRPHALAAVTQVLRHLLEVSQTDNDLSSLLGGSQVTAGAPDRVLDTSGASDQPRLNLFLHGITFNPAYRNADLPTRNRQGQPVANPLLGLDLHYMLSAYGQDDLQSEILMGFGMEALHRNPMPNRQLIEEALTPPEEQAIPGLNMTTLDISELAQQIESIKITPEALSVDDMSKLWTATQTHLRTSVFYAVSVVLIESQVAKRTPLPVLTRGPSVTRRIVETFPDTSEDNLPQSERQREEGILAQPGLIPPVPTLEAVSYPDEQVAARMGESITLEGQHLDGDQVLVRFTESRSRRTLDVEPTEESATRLVVSIPPEEPPPEPELPDDEDPTVESNWRAGFYSVAAVVRNSVPEQEEPEDEQAEPEERISNELPFVLAPTIDDDLPPELTSVDLDGESVPVLNVTCSPLMHPGQKASLIVGAREVPAEPSPEADAGSEALPLRFRIDGLESGADQWVRLVVDGVSSIFIDRSQDPPRFDGPRVDIP